jgi:chemotaxis protein MotB
MSDESSMRIRIVRKRITGEEEDHHGGVWKLALADFMTAMMAFFLVMWLINSTTKENRAAIVQYFNPVHLIDSSSAHKGLRDPKDIKLDENLAEKDGDPPPSRSDRPSLELHIRAIEEELHKSPLETLGKIAVQDRSARMEREGVEDRDRRTYNDPYDRGTPPARQSSLDDGAPLAAEPPAPHGDAEHSTLDARRADAAAAEPVGAGADEKARIDEINKSLKDIVRSEALSNAPEIEATQSDEGTIISLTDNANFSMFAIGSIEPSPQLVRLIGRIGLLLARTNGDVEVRGHTDGRAYKGRSYDNWRLSADRANMVRYMLIRGGLGASRFFQISGFADTKLKSSGNPLAAANRRIEILLRKKAN